AAIGSSCSSEAVPGAPILWKAGIVTVSPSNTAPKLTAADRGPDFDGYLRTAHNDLVQGKVAAEFARKSLKVGKAATIHDGSPYAEGLANAFADNFKKLGGTITSQEAIAPTTRMSRRVYALRGHRRCGQARSRGTPTPRAKRTPGRFVRPRGLPLCPRARRAPRPATARIRRSPSTSATPQTRRSGIQVKD